jgi:hypothetical protein
MSVGTNLLQVMDDLDDQFSATDHASIGYRLLNNALSLIDSAIAKRSKVEQTDATISTAKDTEKTARPATLRRIDKVVMEDTNGRPWYEMEAEHGFTGLRNMNHSRALEWVVSSVTGTGRPYKYYVDSSDFYWGPYDPNAVYTVRILGYYTTTAITASGTFGLSDDYLVPIALMALVLFRTGVEDPTEEHTILMLSHLTPLLDSLEHFWQHGGRRPNYADQHYA